MAFHYDVDKCNMILQEAQEKEKDEIKNTSYVSHINRVWGDYFVSGNIDYFIVFHHPNGVQW